MYIYTWKIVYSSYKVYVVFQMARQRVGLECSDDDGLGCFVLLNVIDLMVVVMEASPQEEPLCSIYWRADLDEPSVFADGPIHDAWNSDMINYYIYKHL